MYEVEFELDPSGSGEFRPSGNVVRAILSYVKAGEFDQAASLLAAADPEVGDKLVEEGKSGASRELWRAMAKLFGQARDVARAALCAEAVDDFQLAASFHEEAYDWEKAAETYKRAGNLHKAAEMYERGLSFDKAAAIYYESKDFLNAANCYARAGAHYHAGHLYMKVGKYEQAVENLQRVDRMQKWFVESTSLLGQFFEKAGNKKMAAQQYAEVIKSKPIDDGTKNIHHRLAAILAEGGHHDKAAYLWNNVLEHDPEHSEARESIMLLPAHSRTVAPPPPKPGAPSAATAEPPPLMLPDDAAPPTGPVVAVRNDFDVLRELPIFAELSLDELRSVHNAADRSAFDTGGVLIEQGKPGAALFVIVSGEVKVEVLAPGKPPTTVASLGPGASLGEMAMVDAAPASARVTALSPVSAFRFPLDRLGTHLAADPRAGFKVMRVLGKILSTRLREANRALAS